MKSFKFWRVLSMLLGLIVCSSCGDDDEFPTFKFDEDGTCYYPSVSAISKESFGETVVGYGWKHVSTYEVGENGECLKNEYYTDLDGVGPHHRYFESATSLKTYVYVDAYPASGFRTSIYEYMDANRVVASNQHTTMQIISVDKDVLKVLEYLAVRAGGTKVYGYVTYKRMTEQELKECQKAYPVDLANLQNLDISIPGEVVFVKGKKFEFDVLRSNGPYSVEASKEETCNITCEGNHVKVTLLQSGARITVSDGLRHRMFRLFSTDEELEPTGTDIYDFTYTQLTLNKSREFIAPDGYALNYKYGRMGTKPREEYYGSILSKYNPSGLLVVDADKQARFLVLDGGEVYLKDLLPESVLDALAGAGEGHAIEYKLELVNASGVVFQILPFKVVYKEG